MYNIARCNQYAGRCDICKKENGCCDNQIYKDEMVKKIEKEKEEWAKDHPLCKHHCPCSMHPELCPSFDNCPHW